jgi:hypothetical protein
LTAISRIKRLETVPFRYLGLYFERLEGVEMYFTNTTGICPDIAGLP